MGSKTSWNPGVCSDTAPLFHSPHLLLWLQPPTHYDLSSALVANTRYFFVCHPPVSPLQLSFHTHPHLTDSGPKGHGCSCSVEFRGEPVLPDQAEQSPHGA